MAFNVPVDSNGQTNINTAIQNQIHVDGVNTKIIPAGSEPSVVYRVGDGTVHPEGWDNVVGNEYLDFYLSRGLAYENIEDIDVFKWVSNRTATAGQTLFTLSNNIGNASVFVNGVFQEDTTYIVDGMNLTFNVGLEEDDSVNIIGGRIQQTLEGGGGQFLGETSIKGIQYMAKTSGINEDIIIRTNMNAFSVDSFIIADGASVVLEDDAVYKVL